MLTLFLLVMDGINPFEPVVTEDAIIARGTLDDKGPTIAAYYAIKILEDMNVDWKKRIHMIIGTDEESDWKCTDRYFKTEEMPTLVLHQMQNFRVFMVKKALQHLT